jgi:hypothetical protein
MSFRILPKNLCIYRQLVRISSLHRGAVLPTKPIDNQTCTRTASEASRAVSSDHRYAPRSALQRKCFAVLLVSLEEAEERRRARGLLRYSLQVGSWTVATVEGAHARLRSGCDSPFRLTNLTLDFLDSHWSSEIDFVICGFCRFMVCLETETS